MSLTSPSEHRPAGGEILDFLRRHHGAEPHDLEVLGGGFWSAAFGYRIGDEELVLRIGDDRDGFDADARAMHHASPALPVPDVLAIGPGFGRWFAISRRHHGRFLEDVGPENADVLAPVVVELLAALRAVTDPRGHAPPWRDWIVAGLTDRPGNPTSGWRARLAAAPGPERTFTTAARRIRAALDACPDHHQLVHADLLHANVLVTPDADAVTAVFSWKCSTWGDAVYDLAWCTFWGRWHPGIAALELWERVAPALTGRDAVDLAVRHHVYELHIGASHLGWYAAQGDVDNLRWTSDQLDELLERGPRDVPPSAGLEN